MKRRKENEKNYYSISLFIQAFLVLFFFSVHRCSTFNEYDNNNNSNSTQNKNNNNIHLKRGKLKEMAEVKRHKFS